MVYILNPCICIFAYMYRDEKSEWHSQSANYRRKRIKPMRWTEIANKQAGKRWTRANRKKNTNKKAYTVVQFFIYVIHIFNVRCNKSYQHSMRCDDENRFWNWNELSVWENQLFFLLIFKMKKKRRSTDFERERWREKNSTCLTLSKYLHDY